MYGPLWLWASTEITEQPSSEISSDSSSLYRNFTVGKGGTGDSREGESGRMHWRWRLTVTVRRIAGERQRWRVDVIGGSVSSQNRDRENSLSQEGETRAGEGGREEGEGDRETVDQIMRKS